MVGPLGIKVLLAVVVVGTALTTYAAHSQAIFAHESAALATEIATFHRQRWERPPLRGRATEGNATERAWQAMAKLEPPDEAQREALAERIYYNKPLGAHAAVLERNAAALDAVRASTSCGWGMQVLPVGHGAAMAVPEYPRAVDAALMLGARALDAEPAECLAIAADVIRLGQDLVPGAPLEAASVAARMASLMVPVVSRCAHSADVDPLVHAARELHALARSPGPTGNGIELGDLLAKVQLLEQARLDRGVVATLRRRPELFRALGYLKQPTRWRSLSPSAYPAGLAEWRRELDWRVGATVPVVATAAEGVEGWLLDDMRGQAVVRALGVGLATVAQRQRSGKIPSEPVSVSDAALADPFTGRPLHWRIAQDGSEITLWSVGENLRDELGTDDWSENAPYDIAVHVPFSDVTPSALAKPHRRRGPHIH